MAVALRSDLSAAGHLAGLAAEVTGAEEAGPAGAGRLAGVAWKILSELDTATRDQIETRCALQQAAAAVWPGEGTVQDRRPEEPRRVLEAVVYHLAELAGDLTEADLAGPADAGRLARVAWKILGELNEVTYAHLQTERSLVRAITAAKLLVTGSGDRAPEAVRAFLSIRGEMPDGIRATTIMAWPGGQPPRRHGRQQRTVRHAAAQTLQEV